MKNIDFATSVCQNCVLESSGKPLDRFKSVWMLFRCNSLPKVCLGPFWEPSHPLKTIELRPNRKHHNRTSPSSTRQTKNSYNRSLFARNKKESSHNLIRPKNKAQIDLYGSQMKGECLLTEDSATQTLKSNWFTRLKNGSSNGFIRPKNEGSNGCIRPKNIEGVISSY